MRRLCRPLAAVLLSAWLPAAAPAAGIEGRVIHPSHAQRASGVEVVLLGLDAEGKPFERSTRTDAGGGYAFRDLPRPAAYLIGARYRGLAFAGGHTVLRAEDPPDATKTLDIRVYEPSDEAAGLTVPSLRVVVEREAGTYRISEVLTLANPGDTVLVRGPEAAPFARVGLAHGHGEVEGSLGSLPEGSRVVEDRVELRGPIFPGENTVRLTYDVETPGPDLETELLLPDPVASLELYVKDFGIAVEAGDLHPARPAREGDVFFQRYLGFDLPARSAVPLHVRALPPRAAPPRWVERALHMLLSGAALLFVWLPVVRARAPEEEEPAEAGAETASRQQALRDLDHDFETGKLSMEDRDRLRGDLHREELRARAPATLAAACACGSLPRPGDRFCSACGKPL